MKTNRKSIAAIFKELGIKQGSDEEFTFELGVKCMVDGIKRDRDPWAVNGWETSNPNLLKCWLAGWDWRNDFGSKIK